METENTTIDAPAPSRARRALSLILWGVFAFVCLLSFTLLKLPEERIRNLVQGGISSALADRGIGFSANEGRISIGLGISYVMKGVTLTPPPPGEPAKIEKAVISPSILPLFLGRLGGTLRLEHGKGYLKASVSRRKQDISATVHASAFDLGKTGLFPLLAELQGSTLLSGDVTIQGDPSVPSTLTGSVSIGLSDIVIDSQSISGFTIPRLSVSEGKVDVEVDKAKATLKTLRLGKKGSATDDLTGTVSGNVALGRSWPSSTLNLKAEFGLSQKLLKAYSLLDALLGAGKRADGSYAYAITGPISAPMPAPAAQP
ncbi:MAG: type II secretion system protein GspN [Oligoflexia bacterium]|nr:type II secretion system protein GspN [Oligoflexia bacterium]